MAYEDAVPESFLCKLWLQGFLHLLGLGGLGCEQHHRGEKDSVKMVWDEGPLTWLMKEKVFINEEVLSWELEFRYFIPKI